MFKALLNGILKTIASILSLIVSPINTLISNLFPGMTQLIGTFNNFVNTYIGNNLTWFFSLLPPIFKYCLTTWFTFVVSYYGIYFTYKGIVKIFSVIQKIKFW